MPLCVTIWEASARIVQQRLLNAIKSSLMSNLISASFHLMDVQCASCAHLHPIAGGSAELGFIKQNHLFQKFTYRK